MRNHAFLVLKLVYEVLYRFLLNKIEDERVDSFKLSLTISNMQEKVNDFYENITHVSHDDLIESGFLFQLKNCVIDYKLYLEDSSDLPKI